MSKVSIIIPAYNEEKRIVSTLEKISEFFKDQDCEIIVVDDGSSDGTRSVVKKFSSIKLNNKRENKGKGYSVKEGVAMSSGDLILFSDADLSTPIEEFDKLKKYVDSYSVVIGSRALAESEVQNNIFRKLLGRVGNLLIRSVVKGIKDTQCGFKLYKSDVAKDLFSKQTIEGFGFDFEILFLAQKDKIKIKEVPVVWKNVEGSKVKPIHYLITLFELFKIMGNNLKGRYPN
ncbi:glycosyltransferase family 2 protein [archaeon]|jgi:dolichyl-phosphate beta-glucosyltransferase|nr:glycosyltransferase family 2 protein [archaeon]MBT6824186.1 glycosyltransferase family 2 protein [archaeon]MBT7106970.1 glycosyltransferase family 2 protein [archaeon]MBT7297582.1 glycosyltransferase family 2 protein [archaeon]